MWKNYLLLTGSRTALFTGQFIILGLCLIFIFQTFQNNILPDKYAKDNYSQTNCFLISKKLTTYGSFIQQYRADFLISYNVNGVQYNRWVSGNGLDSSYTVNKSDQDSLLSQYNAGETYSCWYSPQNPQSSMLVKRHRWESILPLIFPIVVALIALFFLIKDILQSIGVITVKTFDLTAWDALE